ncbi:distal tail protein Dit, partial [Lactococcus lactis]
MAFTINFGSEELTKYIEILDVRRNIGSEIEVTTQESVTNGSEFMQSKYTKSTIEVDFISFGDITTLRRKIAAITYTSSPAPLIFSDEPNLIYQAIRHGKIEIVENRNRESLTGTITFLVPSGVAVSSYTQKLNADNSGGTNGSITVNSDNTVDVLINNQGTIPAYPTFKFTHKSDNAFIGLAGQNGV